MGAGADQLGLAYRVRGERGVWKTHCNFRRHEIVFGDRMVATCLDARRDGTAERYAKEYGLTVETPAERMAAVILHELAHASIEQSMRLAAWGIHHGRAFREKERELMGRGLGSLAAGLSARLAEVGA